MTKRERILWRSAYRIATIAAYRGERHGADLGHEALESAVCAQAIVDAAKSYAGERQ